MVAVHFHIETFDGLESTIKSLLEILDFQIVPELLLTLADLGWWLVVIAANICSFKFVVFLDSLVASLIGSPPLSFTAAALVGTWHETEARVLAPSKFDRENIVEV